MRASVLLIGCVLATLSSFSFADVVHPAVNTSHQVLPQNFKPPQVFKQANVVRNINLDKSYARQTINVIIENIATTPQDEYYLPFDASEIARVGNFEVRDKEKGEKAEKFVAEVADYDALSSTQFYRIKLDSPLEPKAQQTLHISYALLSPTRPLPAEVGQMDKQYLQFTFSAYMPSAYVTTKQKTKVKLPSANIREYTKIPGTNSENGEDPQAQGSALNYGSFGEIPAGVVEPVSIRYEFPSPVHHVSSLERDIEVSHWGGNLATEERYRLEHRGAALKTHFSRTVYASSAYFGGNSWVTKELKMPLKIGSTDAYYIDDVGNVTTSRFRTNKREANLQLMPRYPLYGGWHYKFKVGWNRDLADSLRKLSTGDRYVLRVPFLEGPKSAEGIEYAKMKLRLILPEGAENVKFETSVPYISHDISKHRTFMDTTGRTMLTIDSVNLIDDLRDKDIIVTYEYPFMASLRKPLTFIAGIFSIFGLAWVLANVDVRIGK